MTGSDEWADQEVPPVRTGPEPMVRADFWFSIVLVALGVATVVESLRMPTLAHLGIDPMSAPGLTPGVIGVVITALGLALFARSAITLSGHRRQKSSIAAAATPATDDGAPQTAPGAAAEPSNPIDWTTWSRLAVALALCLVYALGLIGRVPFLWATIAFVFVFIVAFGWHHGRPMRLLISASVMALTVGFAVTVLFEQVFLVRLP